MVALMQAFEFDRFARVLSDACIAAFSDLLARHSAESVYCAALYTNGSSTFLLPFILTEQGLDSAVERYMTKPRKESRSELRSILRDMPEDSPYHLEGKSHFADVNVLMTKVAEAIASIDTARGWDAFEAFQAQLDGTLCAALRAADCAGIFGPAAKRDQVILTVMMGDQDGSVFEFARELNSAKAVKRFKREWHRPGGAV